MAKIKKISELKIGDDKNYKRLLKAYFDEIAPDLFDMVEEEERYIAENYGEDVMKILESDSGKLSIKYIPSSISILVLGLFAEGGKISYRDLKDVIELYNLILEQMKRGKPLMANMNNNSEGFVDGLIKRAEKMGIKTKKEILSGGREFVPNPNNLKELIWRTIKVTIV